MMKHWQSLSTILLASFLAACGGNKETKVETPNEMYQKAQDAYAKEEYRKAAKLFSELEQEFPYSKHTKDGLLKTAYSHFEIEEYEDAAATTKRYLELYPGSKNSDYALHLLGLLL